MGWITKMTNKFTLKKYKDSRTGSLFVLPYVLAFLVFIIVPVLMGMLLSFTYFNLLDAPRFIGLTNFISIFTSDSAFMQQIVPNTITFAVVVGPVGYLLGFFLAWLLAQIPHRLRTILTLVIYSP
jgi:multiple sugar transport system permease protein